MIKRRRLNPNYRSEHVLEPLEPEPDQWLEDDGEELVAEAASLSDPLAAEEPALTDEPMEALFAELLAEDETIAIEAVVEEPVALEAAPEAEPESFDEPLPWSDALASPDPVLVAPDPEPEPVPPPEAAAPEVDNLLDAELPAAPLLLAPEEPELNPHLLAEPAEPEDLELDLSSWQAEPAIPALPEPQAADPNVLLAPEPLEEELAEAAVEEVPEPFAAQLAPPLPPLPATGMDAVYEALDDEIESPEAMDLLDADGPLPEPDALAFAEAEPGAALAAILQPPASPAGLDIAAPEPEPQPEPVTADPAADFDAPVEAVLSEVAQIIAARGQSLLTRTAKPAEPEPLPAQPALEDVVSSIDEALQTAPAPAPAGPAPATPHRQFSQLDDYVVFSLSGGDYAIPVRDVAEIGRIPVITRIPNVPDFIRGLTNLRGEVVPLLNLPTLLGLQDTHPSVRGRVLFLHGGARGSATGLVVDEVKGIQRIQSTQLEQVSGLVDDKVTSVLRGVHGRGDRLLNVLDLEQLFAMPEFRQLET
ncbi:MAG: purine-binding chemotaxis protein CheW [Bryobacterales bacterium]|nr:purine-binding chemotaxis protein CheW [Bryobacterales bacterium]